MKYRINKTNFNDFDVIEKNKLIMKNFFNNHTPKKFSIIHKSGKSPMKYAVGKLDAGGENFRIILYVKSTETDNYIEQIKVERD